MDKTSHVLIIAEAGVNHNGSLSLAKRLADVAKEAGADIVKYQVFKSEKLVSETASKAEYQKKETRSNESQLDMLRKLELTFPEFKELKEYCDSVGIDFLATSFDEESTAFLGEELRIPLFKIPSGEMDNYPYLVQVAQYGRPVVVSTGMAQLEEVVESIRVLRKHGASDITVLHCNTQYPTPFEDVNLRAMPELGAKLNVRFGYSDHTPGIEVPVAAVAMGATVIEKHFTLNKSLEGPDHKASLDPDELKAMVSAIRHVEIALGSKEKTASPSETANKSAARKSIVASRAIKSGETFTWDNLTTMRPGDGLSPMLWPQVLGTKARRDFAEHEMIEV